MEPEIESLSDGELRRVSRESIAAFNHVCESLKADPQLEEDAWRLLAASDTGESLAQMREDSPEQAGKLFSLAIVAMIHSRRMLDSGKEMLRRGLSESPM